MDYGCNVINPSIWNIPASHPNDIDFVESYVGHPRWFRPIMELLRKTLNTITTVRRS